MNVDDLRLLYEYTDWANERMLAAIGGLSEEQYAREIVSSYPSIRGTIAHIAFGEWLWLRRWRGESPMVVPEWANAPGFAAMRDRIRDTAADRRAYLSELSEEAVGAELHYVSTSGDPFTMPLGGLLVHCANHSTYHRGQLVTMLRQVGATPPNTDYTQFLRSRRTV